MKDNIIKFPSLLPDKEDLEVSPAPKAIFYIGSFHVDLLSCEDMSDYVDYQGLISDYNKFCAATYHLDQLRRDDIYMAEYNLEQDFNKHWKFELVNFKTWSELVPNKIYD